jgi:hypothetical protein
MTNPEPLSTRKTLIPIGTPVAMIGTDYDELMPSGNGEILYGILTSYIVFETSPNFGGGGRRKGWDTAAIITLNQVLNNEKYTGQQLLVIHRYGNDDVDWDYEQTVCVFGLSDTFSTAIESFKLSDWLPKMVCLARFTELWTDTEDNPSEYVRVIRLKKPKKVSGTGTAESPPTDISLPD